MLNSERACRVSKAHMLIHGMAKSQASQGQGLLDSVNIERYVLVTILACETCSP